MGHRRRRDPLSPAQSAMPSYIAYPVDSPWLAPLIADLVWVCFPMYQTALLLGTIKKAGLGPELKSKVEWILFTWMFTGLFHLLEVFLTSTKTMNIMRVYYCAKFILGLLYHKNLFGMPLKIGEGLVDSCEKHYEKMCRMPEIILGFIKQPQSLVEYIKRKLTKAK